MHMYLSHMILYGFFSPVLGLAVKTGEDNAHQVEKMVINISTFNTQ